MQPFIYGFDSEQTEYTIRHLDLSEKQLAEMYTWFSAEQPAAISEEPFFAAFLIEAGLVFGKGIIRAEHWLFHGLVLTETETKQLGGNPFLMESVFDLDQSDTLPAVPKRIGGKASLLFLARMIATYMAPLRRQRGRARVLAVLIDNLKRTTAGQTLVLPRADLGTAEGLNCLYFCLEHVQRYKLSLATRNDFLRQQPRLLLCETHNPPETATVLTEFPPGQRAVDSILRLIIRSLPRTSQLQRIIEVVETANRERVVSSADVEQERTFWNRMVRACERPSVRSIKAWPPCGPELLPMKVAHFAHVWEQNRHEEHFPGLGRRLWEGLAVDLNLVRGRKMPFLAALFKELRRSFDGQTLLELVCDEDIGDVSFAMLAWTDRLSLALEVELPDARFEQLLKEIGKYHLDDDRAMQLTEVLLGQLALMGRQGFSADDQKVEALCDRVQTLMDTRPNPVSKVVDRLIFSMVVEWLFPMLITRPRLVFAFIERWSLVLEPLGNSPAITIAEVSGRSGASGPTMASLRLACFLEQSGRIQSPEVPLRISMPVRRRILEPWSGLFRI